ncbi:MAG: M48 family metallopeptidase [Ignavibacteriae bacterium]|nr:M48 family peptidase [Ignavibacteriota bacterium]NOG96893.1 M48 family metallopeptidase [Ignavibacteriota bacterium]
MNAKKYNNIKLAFGIGKGVASFILILLFVWLGYSSALTNYLSGFTSNNYLLFILFVVVSGAAASILFYPVNFYTGFLLEHKYNLSNQTFLQWTWENLKGTMIGGVIGLPILLLFYYALNTFGGLWWLPFSIILFIISVLLAKIVPIIILPLFYKISPLDNDDLKERILALSKNVGMKVENVFQFDMSKNTKKANAAFTGLGKSKKILLGDTLLESYSNDEIETVIAHELGHYKHKHIVKNIIISTAFSFLTFFLIALLYDLSLSWFDFTSRTQIAALPILSLWGMLIGLIQTPISNSISRKFEYEADEYAINSTGKTEAFINTLDKLTDQNLGDREPHPLVEWFSYSHPSIKKRSEFILSLEQKK